jgi:hypothetical protein
MTFKSSPSNPEDMPKFAEERLMTDEITNDLFHCCALVAFVEQARLQQAWPDQAATRRRAFGLYETELRSRQDRERTLTKPSETG